MGFFDVHVSEIRATITRERGQQFIQFVANPVRFNDGLGHDVANRVAIFLSQPERGNFDGTGQHAETVTDFGVLLARHRDSRERRLQREVKFQFSLGFLFGPQCLEGLVQHGESPAAVEQFFGSPAIDRFELIPLFSVIDVERKKLAIAAPFFATVFRLLSRQSF